MKIALFGNKESSLELLDHLKGHQFDVAVVVTLNKEIAKKYKISGKSNQLEDYCKSNEITVYNPTSYALDSNKDEKYFNKLDLDVGLVTGWQRIIPADILNSFSHGIYGWHGSGFNLPNGRGRSPLNWTIRLGLEEVHHNCFRYSKGVDNGDIFETKTIKINKEDYISDVQKKALIHIKSSSLNLLKNLQAGKNPTLRKQIEHPYINFPKLNEESGFLDPHLLGVKDAVNLVRSCSKPFPGAYIKIANENLKVRIWRLRGNSVDSDLDNQPAGYMRLKKENQLYVRFKDGVAVSEDLEIENSDSSSKGMSTEWIDKLRSGTRARSYNLT